MSDKVEATFHGRGCPWCGSDRYYTETAKYYCPDCHQCGVLPTPVYRAEDEAERAEMRALVTDLHDHCNEYCYTDTSHLIARARWRKVYLRSLLTTLVISLWFFCWLFLLGNWGYAVAIPTTALYFACEEMTW